MSPCTRCPVVYDMIHACICLNTPQVKAFERRCRHLYGASPAAKRKRAAEEAAAQAAGVSYPCGGFLFPGVFLSFFC